MAAKLSSAEQAAREAFEAMLPHVPDAATRAAFMNLVARELLTLDHRRVFWGDRLLTLDKAMGFLDDAAFKAAFDAVWSDYPYDQYGGAQTIAWRLHTLVWAARHALALPAGDFIECGVFRGDMSWVIAKVTDFATSGRRMFLFDSFVGLDPALERSDDYPDNPGYLAFANQFYGAEGIHEQVVDRFSGWPQVEVVRGMLPGTLDVKELPDSLAFVHIDLNSPVAELACLERLFPRLVAGGMVILDDYGWHSFRAQRLSADAYFDRQGHYVLELPTGQGLVVRHM